jgi:hypothetical protein
VASRRQLNTLTDRVGRDRADDAGVGTVKTRMNEPDGEDGVLGALFDLEAVCANPGCRHERGFHLATATSAACGYTGCGCQDFQRQASGEPAKQQCDDQHDRYQDRPIADGEDPRRPVGAGDRVSGHARESTRSWAESEADPFGHLVGDPDDPEALETLPLGEPDPADEGPDVLDETSPVTAEQWAYFAARVATKSQPIAQEARADGSSGPVSDDAGEMGETSVLFPVVAAGHPAVALDRLLEPAHRVADIVQALEPMLAPPLAVQQLQILVEQAAAVEVTDQASYDRACDLYERLAANEKGIEETIGPVVGFFYKPWKALCDFRARFAKPVAEQKKRLSDVAGAWQLAEKRRAEEQARRDADAAAAAERERLRLVAEEATKAAATLPPESSLAQMFEQTAVQAQTAQLHVVPVPVPAAAPPRASAGTGNRKSKVAVVVDADAFYEALAADSTRRVAAPINQAYLDKQACDLGDELVKRFPGVEAREKGGLTAKGRR